MDDPEFIARLEGEIKRKSPEPCGFNVSVSPGAMLHVGHIVVQWGALMSMVDTEIHFLRLCSAVPKDLRDEPIRAEARYQLAFMRRASEFAFADEREGATKAYQRNLSAIYRHKGVRDALAHGTYSLTDNEKFNGAAVLYKHRLFRFSMELLQQTGAGISQCTGFLLTYRSWLSAPAHLKTLRAWREKYPERIAPPTSPDGSDKPSPQPQS